MKTHEMILGVAVVAGFLGLGMSFAIKDKQIKPNIDKHASNKDASTVDYSKIDWDSMPAWNHQNSDGLDPVDDAIRS
jgi:hypothetical protein